MFKLVIGDLLTDDAEHSLKLLAAGFSSSTEITTLRENEFLTAILEQRSPLIDIAMLLNMTVAGIIAHQSALKDGERMKVPQYRWPVPA